MIVVVLTDTGAFADDVSFTKTAADLPPIFPCLPVEHPVRTQCPVEFWAPCLPACLTCAVLVSDQHPPPHLHLPPTLPPTYLPPRCAGHRTARCAQGLSSLIGGAFSLIIVNLLTLMANCWPSAPASPETAAAAQGSRGKSGKRGYHIGSVQEDGDGGGDDELTPLIDSVTDSPVPMATALATAAGGGAGSTAGGAAPDLNGSATDIAKASTEARAAKEEGEKKKRERGYGTWKLLQLARPHKGWLYAGCAVLLLR